MYKISCIAGAAIAALAAPAFGQTVRTLPDVVVSASAAPLPSDQVGSAVTVIESAHPDAARYTPGAIL